MAYALGFKSKINFGKYKGFHVDTVLDMNPEYIVWVNENTHHRFNKYVLGRAITYIDKKDKVLC